MENQIKVTPEMVDAGTKFVMDFFPAEWGSSLGITQHEAEALTIGVLKAVEILLVRELDAKNRPAC